MVVHAPGNRGRKVIAGVSEKRRDGARLENGTEGDRGWGGGNTVSAREQGGNTRRRSTVAIAEGHLWEPTESR